MRIDQTKDYIAIMDDFGDKVILDKKQREELKQVLDGKELIFEKIDMNAFVYCAMNRKAEFMIKGKAWIIDSFVIENHAETRFGIKGVLLGRCSATCTIYDKETGCKYYGIFLKNGDCFNLRLVAKEG